MADQDFVNKIHQKAKILAQNFVTSIAAADDGVDISETILLSAMTIGMLLGSNAETMRQTTNIEGVRSYLTIAFATAGSMIDSDQMSIRFEVVAKGPNPAS